MYLFLSLIRTENLNLYFLVVCTAGYSKLNRILRILLQAEPSTVIYAYIFDSILIFDKERNCGSVNISIT